MCDHLNGTFFSMLLFQFMQFHQSAELVNTTNNNNQKRVRACVFRKLMRFDCVELKQTTTTDNQSCFQFARIAWIVSTPTSNPKCIALPLFPFDATIGQSSPRKAIQALYANMRILTIPNCTTSTPLVHFNVADIARIVQVQFVLSKLCTIGIVNRFYHSKVIFSTSKHSKTVDVPKEL